MIRRKGIAPKAVFSLLGIGSLVWFLVRVIPKPSRAAYPCMRGQPPGRCDPSGGRQRPAGGSLCHCPLQQGERGIEAGCDLHRGPVQEVAAALSRGPVRRRLTSQIPSP